MDSSAPYGDSNDSSNRRDDTFGSTDPGNFGSSAERRGDTFGSAAGTTGGTGATSSSSSYGGGGAGASDDINTGFPSGGDGAGGYSSNNPGTDFQASGGGSACESRERRGPSLEVLLAFSPAWAVGDRLTPIPSRQTGTARTTFPAQATKAASVETRAGAWFSVLYLTPTATCEPALI